MADKSLKTSKPRVAVPSETAIIAPVKPIKAVKPTPAVAAGAAILADPAPAAAPTPAPIAAPTSAPIIEPTLAAAVVAAAVEPTAPDMPAAPIKKEVSMEQTYNTAVNETHDAANKAQAMFGDMNDRAKSAMEKSTKTIEEMNDFAKGNIEAIVESSKIAAKGFETMGQDAAEYGRRSFESATAAMKTLASIKSPTEFMKMQADYVRQSFDMMIAEGSKNSEAMIKLAGDVMQPISSRVSVAAEKVKLAA